MTSPRSRAFWRTQARLPVSVRRFVRRIPGARRVRDRMLGSPRGPAPARRGLRPIVYLPTWLTWDSMRQRPQFLLEGLAMAGHEVWFVDPRIGAPEVRGGVHLVPDLRAVPAGQVILYIHFPLVRHLIRRFVEPVVIYDVLDDLSIYDTGDAGLPARERAVHQHRVLLDDAQVVTASHPLIRDDLVAQRPDALLVENGVDVSRFTLDGDVAAELPDGPIVGYHGAIARWFDFELVSGLAGTLPSLTFLLVGPVDDDVVPALNELLRHPNVTWVGARHPDEIPAWVRGFRVGLIPFVVDDLTSRVSPLKLYEYFACGVPVISTPLPSCVEHPFVQTASSVTDFARLVDLAAQTGPAVDELRHAAIEASWVNRLRPLIARLDELGARRVT